MACNYLVQEQDTAVLKNLSQMGQHLEELLAKMLEKEAEYEAAKGEYEHYKNGVLPEAMYTAGVSSLSLLSGNTIKTKTEFHCSPNKNIEDRSKLVKWLQEHGGDYLIAKEAVVPGELIGDLKSQNIPYVEHDDMNTNKVKTFLKGLIGEGTGEAQINIEDIPREFNFTKLVTADIQVAKVKTK
jgi:hypothetical protein